MDPIPPAIPATEPIWMHPMIAPREGPLGVLEPLATVIQCHRGQEIYKEDSPAEDWFRIVCGAARRFSIKADGKRQIVDLLLPGDIFGFGARGRHHFAVEVALDQTLVARYPRRRLEALADADPDITESCATHSWKRYRVYTA
jgi:CRP/FNR family transcriptional regulator, nitrogen fixation regulation protein